MRQAAPRTERRRVQSGNSSLAYLLEVYTVFGATPSPESLAYTLEVRTRRGTNVQRIPMDRLRAGLLHDANRVASGPGPQAAHARYDAAQPGPGGRLPEAQRHHLYTG